MRKKSVPAFLCTSVSSFLDQIFVQGKEWMLSGLAGVPVWVGQIASSLINIIALLVVFLSLFALVSVLERAK